MPLLHVDDGPGPGRRDKKVGLPTEEGRNLKHVDHLGGRRALFGKMDIAEDRAADLILHLLEYRQPLLDADAARGSGHSKGVDVLLRAFRAVHEQRAGRAELHVLGGFESEAFEAELRGLQGELPVTFHGAFDPGQLHAVAPDVGVFPSTCMETFGIVLDECFELGRPCITSDLGALPERAGAAGLVAKAGDVGDLARAMLRLLDEPALWGELTGRIPAPPPGLDEHVDALAAIYEGARAAAPDAPQFTPVDRQRRLSFLLKQRDTAMSQLLPPGGPQ